MRLSHLAVKVKVMKELGMTDSEKLKAYLKSETRSTKDKEKKDNLIDRLCHDIINNYFDGDKTYVLTK